MLVDNVVRYNTAVETLNSVRTMNRWAGTRPAGSRPIGSRPTGSRPAGTHRPVRVTAE